MMCLNQAENTMPTLSYDPVYSQLLDTNKKLCNELQDEIFINKSNEKRLLANPIQNINSIRSTLNTVWTTLQNISAERDQYQNLLNNENRLVRDLRNEIHDTRNQFLRSEWLLEESRDQIQRITQMHTN